MTPLAAGTTLDDRYRIDAFLGAGGMATVWRAHDLRLGRDVALKALTPHHAADPSFVARFDREARALAAVGHAHVVAVYDVAPGDPAAGRAPYLVMELVEGGTLADRLVAQRLAPAEVVDVIAPIADALAAIHAAGLVHRDVKPGNILLATSGPKLADLGIAGIMAELAGDTTLTAAGSLIGTLRYLAPEVLAGGAAGPAADTYALALVTHEALTGRPVREAVDLADVLATVGRNVPAPSEVDPTIGRGFDAPLAAALDPEPARRPDPRDFGRALRGALGPVTVVAATARPNAAGVDLDQHAVQVLPTPAATSAGDATAVLGTPPHRAGRPGRPAADGPPILLIGTLALLGVLVSIGVLSGLAAGGPLPTPSVAGVPSGSPSPGASFASPSPSPSSSPTPSPSRPATPTPGPTRIEAAIADVRVAIEAAAGGRDGLKGKETNDLRDLVADVERAVADEDLGLALERARRLVERSEKLAGDDADDPDTERGRLVAAARELREAVDAA